MSSPLSLSDIRIEPAEWGDAEQLVIFECDHWGVKPESYALWSWVLSIRYEVVLKATVHHMVVGVASMRFTANGSAYVDEIIVAEAFRRKGLASRLMDAMIERSAGRPMVGLTWESNEASHNLMLKHGFVRLRNVGSLFGNPDKVYWEYERLGLSDPGSR